MPPTAPDDANAQLNRFERRRLKNREALIEAAIELFQTKGLRDTKLEEICELADVAPRTFFNHFATREHLYAAISEQRGAFVGEAFEEAANGPGDLEERLVGLLGRMGEYLSSRPAYRELIGTLLTLPTESGSPGARSGAHGRNARRFIEVAVARGEIPARHRPEVLADLLVGAMSTATANWCADEGYDVERELVDTARALVDVFTAAPGGSRK